MNESCGLLDTIVFEIGRNFSHAINIRILKMAVVLEKSEAGVFQNSSVTGKMSPR